MSDKNVFHIPSGCKNEEKFSNYVHSKIMECLKDFKSKEETLKHLLDEFQIEHYQTNRIWDLLEIAFPDFFIDYENHRKFLVNNAQITEMMKQSLSALKSINSTSEQILKLMSDGIEQAKSLKRQQEEQEEQVRGGNEQSENQQDQNQQLPQETRSLDNPGVSNQRRRCT